MVADPTQQVAGRKSQVATDKFSRHFVLDQG